MKPFTSKLQIGKNGLTESFIETLNLNLKNHRQVRIHVLKSAGHTKQNIKDLTEKIASQVKLKCAYRTLGFTIIITKLSWK